MASNTNQSVFTRVILILDSFVYDVRDRNDAAQQLVQLTTQTNTNLTQHINRILKHQLSLNPKLFSYNFSTLVNRQINK